MQCVHRRWKHRANHIGKNSFKDNLEFQQYAKYLQMHNSKLSQKSSIHPSKVGLEHCVYSLHLWSTVIQKKWGGHIWTSQMSCETDLQEGWFGPTGSESIKCCFHPYNSTLPLDVQWIGSWPKGRHSCKVAQFHSSGYYSSSPMASLLLPCPLQFPS